MEDIIAANYEIAYLLRDEADFTALSGLLSQHKATITLDGQMKRIAFSYPIKKETSGVFGFLRFTADATAVEALEHELKTTPQVLRSMILRLPAAKESSTGRRTVAPHAAVTGKPFAERKPVSPAALSNEALEKKIEEILQ